jgi:diguanylate cyclase (GGDEF)-like protein
VEHATADAVSMVCVPLLHRNDAVGVLKVYSAVPRAFTDREAQALGALSAVIAAQLSHATQYERTAHASLHDALTGVGNRRAYDERLVKESARVARYGRCLSLLLLDLDHFKAVNDEYGHSAGDEALRAVGRVLRRSRLSDDAFRIGGDEFALVLPDTGLEEARLVGMRMSELIAGVHTPAGSLRASIGAAESSEGDPGALHEAADADLRRVKQARDGR